MVAIDRGARASRSRITVVSSISAAALTTLLLATVKLKAPYPMLLADRFLPGAGWIEVVLLGVYAGWVTDRYLASRDTSRLRLAIWAAFSILFFGQLLLGLTVDDRFLMTGRLHLPIPALVIAGPIYRGERFFMPILFLSTVVLVGPAWCSHLCYVGAWDGVAAARRSHVSRRSMRLLLAFRPLRYAIFVMTPVVAVAVRLFGVGTLVAVSIAAAFAVASVATMIIVSRRAGAMVHCTSVCPLGLAGNLLGRISPFRLRITSSCTGCLRCLPACRYGALDSDRLARGKPGLTCTLCGDCLTVCRDGAITIRFGSLRADASRAAFVVLVVTLHALFLGVARI